MAPASGIATVTMAPGEVDLVSKGNFIAENLFKFCVAPDSGKRLRETGVVAPATTLKNKCARSAFEWAASVSQEKKYFTLLWLLAGWPSKL